MLALMGNVYCGNMRLKAFVGVHVDSEQSLFFFGVLGATRGTSFLSKFILNFVKSFSKSMIARFF